MIDKIMRILNRYGYVYLQGLWGTIWLSVVTITFATVLGTVIALIKMSKIKPAQWVINVYIEIIRGTPMLLQMYFFWLVLPKYMPFEVSDTQSILVALILNASAYIAEVIRAGIQAVDGGQTEAALSLGLSSRNTFFRVVLPQAVKNILPAMGNEFIVMIKETALASTFFIPELMTSYKTVQSATFLPIPALTIAGVIYLVLTFILTRGIGVLERRLRSNER